MEVLDTLRSIGRNWWLLAVTGVAWLVVAMIVLRFDYASVTAISVLFGVIVIAAGLLEIAISTFAVSWWRFVRLLLGAIFIVTGVVAFINPGDTFVALAAVMSFYFVFKGAFDIGDAIAASRILPAWWLVLVVGIAEVLLGLWAAGSWRNSATLLVAWTAVAAIFLGVTELVLAFRVRELAHAVDRGTRV
jgi:uncharacterized membrane protein HdeD (DUF308 family)